MKKIVLATALFALTSSTAFAADPAMTAGFKFGKILNPETEDFDYEISDEEIGGINFGYDFGNKFSLNIEVLRGK